VIGDEAITVQHISKLEYLNAVLRETLRLHPPAPAFTVRPKQDEVIGGKYHVTKDMALVCFLMAIHTDPAVYGEDAEQFRPDRMLNEGFNQLPPNAWKVRDASSFGTSSSLMLNTAVWEWLPRVHWSTICVAGGPVGSGNVASKLRL
jgi:cytochrome P450